MNDYLHRELKYRSERVYEILTDKVQPWSYGNFENRYVNASESSERRDDAEPVPESLRRLRLRGPGHAAVRHAVLGVTTWGWTRACGATSVSASTMAGT